MGRVLRRGGGHSIIFGDTSSQSEAQNLQNSLTSIGYSEIAIVAKSESSFLVTGGRYKYKLDAIVDSNALKKRGFSGAIYSGTTEPLSQNRPIVYPSSADESVTIPTFSTEASFADKKEIDEVIKNLDTQKALAELYSRRATASTENSLPGYIAMRIAYLHMRSDNRNEAEALFRSVVEAKIPVDKPTWLECLHRYARLQHGKSNRMQSYQLYRLLSEHETDPETLDTVHTQIAGLMMELARSEKGTLEEFREYVSEKLSAGVQTQNDQITMRLMFGESYYYDRNWQEAHQSLTNLTSENPNVTGIEKEIGMAFLFNALSLIELGNYDAARESFISACEIPYPDKKAWKHIEDMKKLAAQHFRKVARDFNRPQDIQYANDILGGAR